MDTATKRKTMDSSDPLAGIVLPKTDKDWMNLFSVINGLEDVVSIKDLDERYKKEGELLAGLSAKEAIKVVYYLIEVAFIGEPLEKKMKFMDNKRRFRYGLAGPDSLFDGISLSNSTEEESEEVEEKDANEKDKDKDKEDDEEKEEEEEENVLRIVCEKEGEETKKEDTKEIKYNKDFVVVIEGDVDDDVPKPNDIQCPEKNENKHDEFFKNVHKFLESFNKCE